jgi:hypothetical protein
MARDSNLLPEPVQEEIKKLKMLWGFCCCSPLLYLFVSWMLKKTLLSSDTFFKFPQLSDFISPYALIALAVVQAWVFFVQWLYIRKATPQPDSGARLVYYRRRTFALLAVSESGALMGFIVFLLCGDLMAMFVFGLAAMVFYAQSYPSFTAFGVRSAGNSD